MTWYPHVTVATIIERDGKYLLVEELSEGRTVINQPAGHLEQNECLVEAAVRETFEETGWKVSIEGLVGIGLYTSPNNGVTYHRTTFFGKALEHDQSAVLDEGILRAVWMSYEEMIAANNLRSHLVLDTVARYRNGHRYPLEMVYN